MTAVTLVVVGDCVVVVSVGSGKCVGYDECFLQMTGESVSE